MVIARRGGTGRDLVTHWLTAWGVTSRARAKAACPPSNLDTAVWIALMSHTKASLVSKVKRRFITIRPTAVHHQAMLDNKEMARRIKTAIEESLNHNQASIAGEFGISEQAVSSWISTGKVDKRKLPRLAALTGRPVSYFLPDESDPVSSQEDASTASPSQVLTPQPAMLATAYSWTQIGIRRYGGPALSLVHESDARVLCDVYALIVRGEGSLPGAADSKELKKLITQRATDLGVKNEKQQSGRKRTTKTSR